MADLKGLNTAPDSLETLRKIMGMGGSTGSMPYGTLQGLSEAPHLNDQQAETYGALAQIGAKSPTFAGGLIEGFGTGMKMSIKEL